MDKIKGFIKEIKENYEAAVEVRTNIFRTVEIIEKFRYEDKVNVTICYDPLYLKATNYKIAACLVTGEYSIMICVDDIYKSLDMDVRGAIVYHEIAHYINKDYKENGYKKLFKRLLLSSIGKCDNQEILADRYAAEKSSKESMTKALNAIKEIIPSAKKEIDLRIKALK